MERGPNQRLSPRALYELLDASHAVSTAALERTRAMAESRPLRIRERRLIGVAVNAVPWQMDLSAGYWRHHALDDILSGIRAHADASEIEDAGLRVPDDVAVAGIDDIDVARMVNPSLTSVRQNQTELVTALVDAMFDLLDRPEVPPWVKVLPIELIVRESSVSE